MECGQNVLRPQIRDLIVNPRLEVSHYSLQSLTVGLGRVRGSFIIRRRGEVTKDKDIIIEDASTTNCVLLGE